MQNKLRLRFFIISWILLLLFLLALCTGVSVYMYQSEADETTAALHKAAESRVIADDTRGMVGFWLNEHGQIEKTRQSHMSLTDETLEALAAGIEVTGDKSSGELEQDGMRYRYLSILQGGGAWTVIVECSREQALLKTLLRNSLIFTLVGAVLLLPVCLLLTRWVSKPIEVAWEKQNDFVSDATHELKTPLTVIATNTEAVMSNPDATIESQARWLGSIRGETARMAGLVGDLLFLAKIDANEIHLDPEEIEISDMLEGMCMERESEMFESGQMFDYELTSGLRCRGDRKLIMKMTEALLDNAQKYTPKGGSIRMVVNRDRRLRLRIVLSNSGDTIPPEALEKIFDRFYRLDPSRTRGTGGYGLGLCVARSIAELHNGELTARSENGINVFTAILGDAEPDDGKN